MFPVFTFWTRSWLQKPHGLVHFYSTSSRTLNKFKKRRRRSVLPNWLSSKKYLLPNSKPLKVMSDLTGEFLSFLFLVTDFPLESQHHFVPLYDYFIHIEKHKGARFLVLAIKDIRLSIERYLANNPMKNEDSNYVSLNSKGLPKKLGPLLTDVMKNDKTLIQVLLSFLSINRAVKLDLRPDFSSVVDSSTATLYPCRWVCKEFINYLESINPYNIHRRPKFQGYHYSNKSSPFSDYTFRDCLVELLLLPEDVYEPIFRLGGWDLRKKMNLILSHITVIRKTIPDHLNVDRVSRKFKKLFPKHMKGYPASADVTEKLKFLSKFFRSIAVFSEFEGKTRIIALLDYWSQTALKPLHDSIFKLLKSIPQDQTFDQAEGLSELSFSERITYYSYDLSAFTDRFPIDIVLMVLTELFGSQYANDFNNVINSYPFGVQHTSAFISYGCGNPMGSYGSWAITSLSHHFVLFWACRNLNIEFQHAKYKLLGDDIVLWDSSLALEYKRLISVLGVKISEKKTVQGNLFTFAKRIFYPQGDISPLSFRSWMHSMQDIPTLVEFYHEMVERTLIPKHVPKMKIFEGLLTFWSNDRLRTNPKSIFRLKELISFFDLFDKSSVQSSCNLVKSLNMTLSGSPTEPIRMSQASVINELAVNILSDLLNKRFDKIISFELFNPLVMKAESDDDISSWEKLSSQYQEKFSPDIDKITFFLTMWEHIPHFSVVKHLIDNPKKKLLSQIEGVNPLGSIQELLDLFDSVSLLDLTTPERLKFKRSELGPKSIVRIKRNSFLLKLRQHLIISIKKKGLQNLFPLMVIKRSGGDLT